LEKTHSLDYKVDYVSDPLVIVHGDMETTHADLKARMESIGIWSREFMPIEIPRTDRSGELTYVAGFKSAPRSRGRFDHIKSQVEQSTPTPEFAFSGENSIEAPFPVEIGTETREDDEQANADADTEPVMTDGGSQTTGQATLTEF
jgi:hypothetical protein